MPSANPKATSFRSHWHLALPDDSPMSAPRYRGTVTIWRVLYWSEQDRIETKGSGLDYLTELAKLHGSSYRKQAVSAYWGASGERIPSSAFELSRPSRPNSGLDYLPGLGQNLPGANFQNIALSVLGQQQEKSPRLPSISSLQKLEPSHHSFG
ncbi:hypothetical protein CEK25_011200 [Fusarium fujikuroi]|nr:hypothetical protein CEK25_011200 [Fusarium fujikuroi]